MFGKVMADYLCTRLHMRWMDRRAETPAKWSIADNACDSKLGLHACNSKRNAYCLELTE